MTVSASGHGSNVINCKLSYSSGKSIERFSERAGRTVKVGSSSANNSAYGCSF